MIDINLYRFRVGVFNGAHKAPLKNRSKSNPFAGNCIPNFDTIDCKCHILFIIYLYCVVCMMSLIMAMSLDCPNFGQMYYPTDGPNTALAFNSWFLVYFFIHIFKQFCLKNYGNFDGFYTFLVDKVAKNFHVQGRAGKCLSVIIIWLYMLNLALVTIVNPSILNPGPNGNLSICYQNVQGLIPFGQLKETNPMLDVNKVLELKAYVMQNKIDIVVLNETWLKKSIHDNEILPNNRYKMYRCDR